MAEHTTRTETLHGETPAGPIRARALNEARILRGLATKALRDGAPKPELRAANARSAARRVIAHARRMSGLFGEPQG